MTPIRTPRHITEQAFWDCPVCGMRQQDNEYHIYLAGDLVEAKLHPRSNRNLFRHYWARLTGQTYPPPEVLAAVQGFPIMWTKCEPSEIACVHKSPNGLEGNS